MRFSTLFATASAAALIAAAAVAQDAEAPPADPPAKAEGEAADPPAPPPLSDLQETVQGLEDEPQPEAAPAEEPAAAPAEEPAAAAAETPTETPAETPAETAAPPAAPAAAAAPPPPLTRVQRDALLSAASRGRLLGAIARAGIIATQDMLSRVSDPDSAGIAGWIAEPEGNGVVVTFYAEGEGDGVPTVVYRTAILSGRVTSRDIFLTGQRPSLNPIQARMAAARKATTSLDHQVCGGENFNALVVPPTAPAAPIDVYQISPQTQRGHFPIGGHFKTTVAADGSVSASRGFTSACLDAPVADPAPGARPAPIAVTHLMDELPTEIHVFLAIWTGHPLVVVAGDPQRLFQVTPEGIAEIPR